MADVSFSSADFARLQLDLVARHVELGRGGWSNGLDQLTNLQRRLGLGPPGDPPDERWAEVLAVADAAAAVEPIVEHLMAVAATLPDPTPEHVLHGWPTRGAFSIQLDGPLARTHFFAGVDDDGRSPLHPSKLDRRRNELTSVVAEFRAEHPGIRRMRGGSWLYTLDRYADLFPDAHLASATVRRGRSTFRGMSHWGQFLDHRGGLRHDRAATFRARLARWDGGDPCELFPIATLEVESPIEVFDA